MLDSKWELSLAKRLDELDFNWIRPGPIKWIDQEGHQHNYFPDFYLVDHILYLDPKNPHAYSRQLDKIKILTQTYDNLIFILSEEECASFNIPSRCMPLAF